MAAVAIVWLSAGCTLHRPPEAGKAATTDIELSDTPFFPQEEYQCGPAALATLLVSADAPASPDRLVSEIYIPKRKGSLQLEIVGAVRRHQRIPYKVRPEADAIRTELQAGRPILVLQNLGLKMLPVYHYAVIVGLLSDSQVVLRSGTTRRLVMPLDDFLATWERTGSWGIVALKGNELPADHDITRYLEAVAELEATGETELAEQGYRTALARDPDNDLATFGLANTLFARQQYAAAATLYRDLLRRNPAQAEAANNLAETLAARRCYRQALEVLAPFLPPAAGKSGMTEFLTATREEIGTKLKEAGGVSADCGAIVPATGR